MEAPAKSTQETALLQVIEHVTRGSEREWRERWAARARAFVEKNPVNGEVEHWTWVLRCAALADPAFFDQYSRDLWNSIAATENRDIA